MTISAPAVGDIKVGFAHQTLGKINGEPQYADIEKWQHQCVCNATTLESTLSGGNNGLAGLAKFPAVYLARTGHAFVRTPNPGVTHFVQHQHSMNNQIEQAINHVWLSQIHSEGYGFGNCTMLDVLQHLYTTYGAVGSDQLTCNQEAMLHPVLAHQPIALLFKQIEDGQKFVSAANVPFTNDQLATYAERLILGTGQ
eukprot:15353536-Ditylum_brightwellii.AAC.1